MFFGSLEDDLIAYATQEFSGLQQVAGLGDMAAHLASLERQTGRRVAPETPDLPFPLVHLWQWFVTELAPRRSSSGFGPNPLSYGDVEAWARFTGRTPTPMEVRVLLRLDDCFMATLRQKPS